MKAELSVQGVLIYLAIAGHLGALVAFLSRRRGAGAGLYFFGFALATAAVSYRWYDAGHVPLQNRFEVFLCLGMVSYPLWMFCRRYLNAGGALLDSLIGLMVLFPAGFVFLDKPQKLPPALQSWLFGPHVLVYILAYIVLIKAGLQAGGYLLGRDQSVWKPRPDYERATYRCVRMALPLLTLGLLLGAWWGKMAWGDYWNWDPKELWALATWLVFVIYLHFRSRFGARHPVVNSLLVIGGLAVLLITWVGVNLVSYVGRQLHSYPSSTVRNCKVCHS